MTRRLGPVAAVDCGTNSTRLLVVDERGTALTRLMEITRLGQGVDATGRLAPEAIDRCVSVLERYRAVMDEHGVERARLVATSAVRDAANGEDFLRAAEQASGVVPELLDGESEGRLSMAGALSELDASAGPFLVVDIGGGSTELMAGSGPDDPDLAVVSLQLGCVRVTERWLHGDPPAARELAEAEAGVGAVLEEAIARHPRFTEARRLVGLAGTVSTLAALRSGLVRYDRARVHHAVLSAADVAGWYRTLAAEPAAARLARPGMAAGRQDVIVGGVLVLDAVMARLGLDECLVSESDILDGLAASLVGG
ncbi:MAG: Ppx/GppA phosphatase family protein [Actinomycetota bacterium]|jgi:exopolyphosphatase/guanosine-5'-triphosphate,3'-diphosphate pyrophosphatase|nr:Ppx/GppA phosphatase family protein [Actinomycetota bacterium]